ncbi:MAG TPA: SDR family NAD(P)-dependent oxidoreductase [Steroidobacteraceae bacterium]|nr:SDR family NAD(P)-dependent oxidoreductase [Steroidobacteraceae bacterium]
MKDFNGKVAFVTGGASGIGLGIVKALLGTGMNVAIGDLRADHLDTALGELTARGDRDRAHGVVVDVSDRKAMLSAADEVERRYGKVHVLVNNAGVGIEGPLRNATFDDWDFGLGVNLGGVVNGLQTFLPRIRQHREGGHVVNTASLAGLVWMPSFMAIYAASKSAVITLSECLRDDLAPDGIGVSVLCPGPVRSNIHESGRNRPTRFRGTSGFGEAEAQLARRIASPLWMDPEVVGQKVLNAIRKDELYVITHGEWRDAFRERMAAIERAMPQEVNPELIRSLRERRTRPEE